MKHIQQLKMRAKKLKEEIRVLYYAAKDKDLPHFPRILIILAIAYALSPIDLIPDFIPVLGYLDDLIILPALIVLAVNFIPQEIIIRARERAAIEPVHLRKNWVMGSFFIFLWLLAILFLIKIFFF